MPGSLEKWSPFAVSEIPHESGSRALETPPLELEAVAQELASAPDDAFQDQRESSFSESVSGLLRQQIAASGLQDKYEFFFLSLYSGNIDGSWAERIYQSLLRLEGERKPFYLFLSGSGGKLESAYKIAKWLRHFARSQRVVAAIPGPARQAATLLALGCSEIHLGLTSELSPFGDPTDPRRSWSACQYAYSLLRGRLTDPEALRIARTYVHFFEDPGFLIDYEEAINILGTKLAKFNSPEYQLAYRIQELLGTLSGEAFESRARQRLRPYELSLAGELAKAVHFEPHASSGGS